MKRRWIPLSVTAFALASSVLASAQDRGRDHHDEGGMRHERTASHPESGRPSQSRGHDDFDRSDRRSSPYAPSNERDARRNPFGDSSTHASSYRNDRPSSASETRPRDRYDGKGHLDATRYGAPPIHTALDLRVRQSGSQRGTDIAIGAQIGGLRVGYVSYGDRGPARRSNFGFGYYAYDPFAPGVEVVASPWYRYSYLPPYVDDSRVIVVDDYPVAWNWDGWRKVDFKNDHRNEAIQDSLDDLRDAFEENSERIADRLVPLEGEVAIFNDGRYDYSMSPDDFQKMFLDGIDRSKTIRYEVLEVRTQGDEIRIRARHEFEDSWGDTQSAIHRITLRRDRGGDYVIREFGTE